MVNSVVFTPMPKASVPAATTENHRSFRSSRIVFQKDSRPLFLTFS